MEWMVGTELAGKNMNFATNPFFCLFASLLIIAAGTASLNAAERPNVIVFITEDQSCHLGCLGTKGLDTPNIDRLASEGVNFTRAFALSPVCSPSKMALLTGTYPHTNSAIRNVWDYGVNFPLPKNRDPSDLRLGGVHEDLPTLIELMNENGVFTAVSSKSHVQPVRKFAFDRGYPNPSTPAIASSMLKDVAKRAKQQNSPYFLWFNIASPHLPFKNVLKANGKWDTRGGLVDDGGATNVDPFKINVPNCYPDTPGVRQDFADYYGNIEIIDQIIASTMNTLHEAGTLENTLIIFTSDHGIGLHRAKQSIYSAGLHIPLLIRAPGSPSQAKLDCPVSHLDVSPTVLDYLGIDQPDTMSGRSLRPILSGEISRFEDRPTILTSCDRYYSARAVTDGKFYYIRNLTQPRNGTLKNPRAVLNTDQYESGPPWFNRTYPATVEAKGTLPHKLLRQIVEGKLPKEELYDLDSDPWMVNNLAGQPESRSIIEAFEPQLAEWRRKTEDVPGNLVRRE